MTGRDDTTLLVVAALVVLSLGIAGAVAVDQPLLGSGPSDGAVDGSTTGAETPAGAADTATDGGATSDPNEAAGGSEGSSDDTEGDADGESGAGSDSDAGETATTTESAPATFRFDVRSVEECGTTCRDVTVSVRNRGGTDAENVDVSVRLLTGDTEVWRGTQSFDRVDAGEARTQTRRINIGYVDGARIRANDGYVTIETTITWDGGEETFSERRQVA